MSIRQLCPPCVLGNHAEHMRGWGLLPGLIGGAWCPCSGDCREPESPKSFYPAGQFRIEKKPS